MVAFSKLPVMMHEEDVIDPRYVNGKIYLVKCKYDNDLVYVGSTKNTLENRFASHKTPSSHCYLNKIANQDWENWYIELYENYPCYNKYQLERREGEVIKQIATLNMLIPQRTKEEYYQDNKEKIAKTHKKYYQNNRDKLNDQHKEYNNKNKEQVAKKQKEQITCSICGSCFRRDSKNRHINSKKCKSVQS
jgi:hypothetical protein